LIPLQQGIARAGEEALIEKDVMCPFWFMWQGEMLLYYRGMFNQ
jgi:hypothetical protein